VERLLKKGEKELLAKTHPDPYIGERLDMAFSFISSAMVTVVFHLCIARVVTCILRCNSTVSFVLATHNPTQYEQSSCIHILLFLLAESFSNSHAFGSNLKSLMFSIPGLNMKVTLVLEKGLAYHLHAFCFPRSSLLLWRILLCAKPPLPQGGKFFLIRPVLLDSQPSKVGITILQGRRG